MPDAVSPGAAPEDEQPREGEGTVDPGGRLQDIRDPELRSAVARLRGSKGGTQTASARASTAEHEASPSAGAGKGLVEPSAAPQSSGERRSMLLGIVRDRKALDTSRVAAAKELRAMEDVDRLTAGHSSEASVWVARRDALALLPQEDRYRWLRENVRDGPARVAEDEEDSWADEGEPL